MDSIQEIHSADTFDNAALEALIDAAKPVVLRGLIAHWPAVDKAKSSVRELAGYLAGISNKQSFPTMIGDPEIQGRIYYTDDVQRMNYRIVHEPFSVALERILQTLSEPDPPSIYVGSASVEDFDPVFAQENRLTALSPDIVPRIWIGNRIVVGGHFDVPQNIACLLAGKRRFTLFPSGEIKNLYIGPLELTPAGRPISMVELANPDFKRYPRFKQALEHAQVAELHPGDAIYIPSMWWHFVESLDKFNVLMNYWWNSSNVDQDLPEACMLHCLLGMQNLPREQRDAWRNIFDYYVFRTEIDPADHLPVAARGVLKEKLSAKDVNYIKDMVRASLKRKYHE